MMAGVAVRVMYVDVEVKFLSLTFDCRKKKLLVLWNQPWNSVERARPYRFPILLYQLKKYCRKADITKIKILIKHREDNYYSDYFG
jgi:hypothetical protein